MILSDDHLFNFCSNQKNHHFHGHRGGYQDHKKQDYELMDRDGGLGLARLLPYLMFLERICLKIMKFQWFYSKLINLYGLLVLPFSIMTVFHVVNAIYSIMFPILSSIILIYSSLLVLFPVFLINFERASLFPSIHLMFSSQMFSL